MIRPDRERRRVGRRAPVARALAAAALATGLLAGCADDTGTELPPAAENLPAAELVRIVAPIEEVITDRTFTIRVESLGPEPVLVVHQREPEQLADGVVVSVVGDLRPRFAREDVADELVWDDAGLLFEDFRGDPYVLAGEVEPVP